MNSWWLSGRAAQGLARRGRRNHAEVACEGEFSRNITEGGLNKAEAIRFLSSYHVAAVGLPFVHHSLSGFVLTRLAARQRASRVSRLVRREQWRAVAVIRIFRTLTDMH